jgi:hypothetical protein
VTPQPVPDHSIANAWRGQPLHYEPVPQPPPPPPDPNAPYEGPRWYRLMVEDIRNFMN